MTEEQIAQIENDDHLDDECFKLSESILDVCVKVATKAVEDEEMRAGFSITAVCHTLAYMLVTFDEGMRHHGLVGASDEELAESILDMLLEVLPHEREAAQRVMAKKRKRPGGLH